MNYIASFDIGSSAIKAVLVDRQCRSHHPCSRDYAPSDDAPGEQDPQLWWDAFCELLQEWRMQGVDTQSLVALTFSGQMQDMIALDTQGDAVRPAVLYMDARAGEQAAKVAAVVGQTHIDQTTRNPFNAASVLPKILHLKDHEPAYFRQTAQVLVGAKDFIIYRLTGAAVTDHTTAATTGMYDFDHGRWANAWMADLHLDHLRLPALHLAGEVVGQVHEAAAQVTGLPQGLDVMCGLGDAAATTLGAGMTHASQSYAYLGTSGWVATLAQKFHRGDIPLFLLPYPEPGWHIRIGPISNAGSVHRWALQFTGMDTEAQGYTVLESLVAASKTDPNLVFLPYLSPERLPVATDKPQGSFVGLYLQTTRADMLRAVLEGVALSLHWACEEVQAAESETLLVVGGATRSAAWMQILADVWNKPVIAHQDSTYLACLGAAATAAVSLGWASSASEFLETASQATAQCCTPNPDQVERLAAKSLAFRRLLQQLSGA